MSAKEIKFKIKKNGNIELLTVTGYGSACLEATRFLEVLGDVKEETRKFTDELYIPATESQITTS